LEMKRDRLRARTGQLGMNGDSFRLSSTGSWPSSEGLKG
jgi:hypothetical protein